MICISFTQRQCIIGQRKNFIVKHSPVRERDSQSKFEIGELYIFIRARTQASEREFSRLFQLCNESSSTAAVRLLCCMRFLSTSTYITRERGECVDAYTYIVSRSLFCV